MYFLIYYQKITTIIVIISLVYMKTQISMLNSLLNVSLLNLLIKKTSSYIVITQNMYELQIYK
jgi:hypothetical protein